MSTIRTGLLFWVCSLALSPLTKKTTYSSSDYVLAQRNIVISIRIVVVMGNLLRYSDDYKKFHDFVAALQAEIVDVSTPILVGF